MPYSITYVGALISILAQVLSLAGVTVSIDDLHTTVNTVITIVSGIVIIYGRYRAGGVTITGIKK